MSIQQIGSPSAIRLRFGPFELNVAERSLRKASEIIPIGGRAYDILIALLENAGAVVGKAELIARAWPDVTVEEGSLRVHLSALRKALGDGQFGNKYIASLQGHGYSFIAPVIRLDADHDSGNASAGMSSLPPALGRMVGRNNVVLEIQGLLQTEQRLITILGAGGIGKTTVALSVGHGALADFSGAAFFVDLSTVTDRENLVGAIASAVGLDSQLVDPKKALLDFLRPRRGLMILDSCERLVEEAAEIAGLILQNCPGIYILATSREALRVSGENVLRLRPLDCPPEQPGLTASEVIAYPAVRLFAERVSARRGEFSLRDDEAPMVAEICRKLDGIPLAIELVAGRAAVFGVGSTVARLGSRLDLLKFGRRTANPRHQTLIATLDWSHDHLSEIERVLLRRVAIFVGHFTLQAALVVAEEAAVDGSGLAEALENLVNKSLIGVWTGSQGSRYRLLDTTRAYALEKLAISGEQDSIAERHASFSIQMLESNPVNLFDLEFTEDSANAVQDYLGNIRAALEWSFGPNGNDRIAIRLAAAASQPLLAMSLLLECRNWMEKAIDRMAADCDPRDQMEIHASLALSLMFTAGNSERVREAFNTALTFAERLDESVPAIASPQRAVDVSSPYDRCGWQSRSCAARRNCREQDGKPGRCSPCGCDAGSRVLHARRDHVRAPRHLERALYSSRASPRSHRNSVSVRSAHHIAVQSYPIALVRRQSRQGRRLCRKNHRGSREIEPSNRAVSSPHPDDTVPFLDRSSGTDREQPL